MCLSETMGLDVMAKHIKPLSVYNPQSYNPDKLLLLYAYSLFPKGLNLRDAAPLGFSGLFLSPGEELIVPGDSDYLLGYRIT